ncbi:MAG: hypothetical protein FWC67_01835 [Defluviitaleaceae bacterium]|nr:hypothetical protein [Defluviitaleaceae bacterium]
MLKKGIVCLGLIVILISLAGCAGTSSSADSDFPAAHYRENRAYRQMARDYVDEIIRTRSRMGIESPRPDEPGLAQEIISYWLLIYLEELIENDPALNNALFLFNVVNGISQNCPRMAVHRYFMNRSGQISPLEHHRWEHDLAALVRIQYWFLIYAEDLRINNPSAYYGFSGRNNVGPNLAVLVHNLNYGADVPREISDEEMEFIRFANWTPQLESPEVVFQRNREDSRRRYEEHLRNLNLSRSEIDSRLAAWEQRSPSSWAESQASRDALMEQERNAADIAQEIVGEVRDFWQDSTAPAPHPNHVRWIRDSQGRIVGEQRTTGTYLLGQ